MTTRNSRGTGTELMVIAGYIIASLRRDKADFQKAFPKIYTDGFFVEFEQKAQETTLLINPQTETVELKNTTHKLYTAIDSLKEPAKIVSGYLKFTRGAIPISPKDFGLTPLLNKIRTKDAEGVLKNLRDVVENLKRYHLQFTEQGLTEDVINAFSQASVLIEENNQKQYEIMSRRKAIVADNIEVINELYKIIMEICQVGKMLYARKNAVKVQEYTFSELLKKVRIVEKRK
jgi:hypothetical protein